MAMKRKVIFQGKEYLDLLQNGKAMVLDKLVFIAQHKTLASAVDPGNAASVSVYGIPHHGESYADNAIITDQLLNVPSTAGQWCATTIDASTWSHRYEAVMVEVDWEGANGTIYLEELGTEGLIFKMVHEIPVSSAQ